MDSLGCGRSLRCLREREDVRPSSIALGTPQVPGGED